MQHSTTRVFSSQNLSFSSLCKLQRSWVFSLPQRHPTSFFYQSFSRSFLNTKVLNVSFHILRLCTSMYRPQSTRMKHSQTEYNATSKVSSFEGVGGILAYKPSWLWEDRKIAILGGGSHKNIAYPPPICRQANVDPSQKLLFPLLSKFSFQSGGISFWPFQMIVFTLLPLTTSLREY